jgi:hypothetical protein
MQFAFPGHTLADGVWRPAGRAGILDQLEGTIQRGHFEETRATAHLPNFDIEIIHGRSAEGDAERLSISLQVIPSFEAFGCYLEAENPFLFWMRVAQTAWAPWLGSAPASLLLGNAGYLPATPKITGPNATQDSDHAG